MTKPMTVEERAEKAAFLNRLRIEYDRHFGAVYLNHFEVEIGNSKNPHGSAKHYTGFVEGYTNNEIELALAERFSEHGGPAGAKIMRAVAQLGINWQPALIWRNVPKSHELDLKESYKNARRLCPICRGEIEIGDAPVIIDQLSDLIAEERANAVGFEPDNWPEPTRKYADFMERRLMAEWRANRASMTIPVLYPDDCDIPF